MTEEDRGFKMLKQQYSTPFSLPVSLDIWKKRGMFPENLEKHEKSNSFYNRANADDVHSATGADATD